MPKVQTLEKLKAENAEAENEVVTETATEATEDEAKAAEEGKEESVKPAEAKADETEPETVESWMQSEESDEERKFTDGDMASLRRKLKAKASEKLDEKDEEIAQLKAKLEGGTRQPEVKPMPTLEGCDYDEDKYRRELSEYMADQVDSRVQASQQAQQLTMRQQQAKAEQDRLLSAHYDRAAKLTEESGIDPELYRASDLAVRTVISSVPRFAKSADDVYEALVAKVGEGSEKLMYYIGRNPQVQMKLKSFVETDDSVGLGVFLGELKSKIANPVKKVTRAPSPAKSVKGDASISQTNWKKKYDKAKSAQERYNIRKEARQAGENVRDW